MPTRHFYLSLHTPSTKVPFLHLCFLPTSSRTSRFSPSRRFPVVLESEFQEFFAHAHHHMSCLFFISSTIVCVTCIISLIPSFVTLSSLALPAALRQKSISAASNIRFVVSLIGHISWLHVIILFIKVLYVSLLLLLFMFLFQSILFSTVMRFFPSRFCSVIAVSDVPSFVISTHKYSYFAQH